MKESVYKSYDDLPLFSGYPVARDGSVSRPVPSCADFLHISSRTPVGREEAVYDEDSSRREGKHSLRLYAGRISGRCPVPQPPVGEEGETMPGHTDSKALKKQRKKKIAMGHKADDHEDQT